MKWTKEQESAIRARGCNLLVSAAAGSGKTAVLVERIKQMILKDGIDVDRLLIVTFTNAAAGEMRERIGATLLEELEKKSENEEYVRKQLNLLNHATINTLHSFCMEIVRRHFHLIDIDPNFRIGDETEIAILKLETLEELFEQKYKEADEGFLELVERFGGNREDTPLQELVLNLYDFIQSKPYPYKWLRENIEAFQMDLDSFQKSLWYQMMLEQIQLDLCGAKEILIEAKKLCEKPDGPAGYLEAILDDIQGIEALMESLKEGWESIYRQVKKFKHKRLGRVSKAVDEVLKDSVKGLRQQAKDVISGIKEKFLSKEPHQYIEDLNALYPSMCALYDLIISFESGYKEKKAERGIADFNDLEHYALSILENEQVAKEYQNQYAYIFVDEYQDSNIVQETILNFIKRDDNLFMVGDVKQSIYRFRLADPTLFMEKYETYQNREGVRNRRIDLGKNFRSREEIIDGVNFIFKQIMTRELGEMHYDEDAYLYKGIDTQHPEKSPIEIFLIQKEVQVDEEEEEDWKALEDIEAEAKVAAERIKELQGTPIYDSRTENFRRLTFKDIVVLLRTTKNWAPIFQEVFMEMDIPVYADVNTGYFDTVEVSVFINLLRIIDNKRQDVPLLSVMRSSIGKFCIEELIQIRMAAQGKSFIEALEKYSQEGEELPLKNKCALFLERLAEWKEESRYMQLEAFIWKLFMDTGYYDYVGAMPGGVQRQANLRMLLNRARQFQATSFKGLFNFIQFIDKLKQSSSDMGAAKILGENDNVVRIMSIHKSKGLEFPVVIVGGMGKQFNLSDMNAPVLFHKDLGIGPKYVDPQRRRYGDTIVKEIMRNCLQKESLSEEMRILYVALTRAKEKLILIGTVKDLEREAQKWAEPVNTFNLLRSKNYLDWIAPVLMRHPDGGLLREWANVEWGADQLLEDSSKWNIQSRSKKDIWKEKKKRETDKLVLRQKLEEFSENLSEEVQQWVDQRLSWQYPHQAAVNIPSKLSVTEINRLVSKKLDRFELEIPSLIQKPRFMEGKKLFSGAEKGTIIHFVMQHLRLDAVGNVEDIQEQIARMVAAELITSEEAAIIDSRQILLFFESPIGRRMLSAPKVYREISFNFVKKACEISQEWKDCNEDLLIQGIIDCYFEEENGLILVDYKTDSLFWGGRREMIEQYRTQIKLYKEALEMITNKKVQEAYLYLFSTNEALKIY